MAGRDVNCMYIHTQSTALTLLFFPPVSEALWIYRIKKFVYLSEITAHLNNNYYSLRFTRVRTKKYFFFMFLLKQMHTYSFRRDLRDTRHT